VVSTQASPHRTEFDGHSFAPVASVVPEAEALGILLAPAADGDGVLVLAAAVVVELAGLLLGSAPSLRPPVASVAPPVETQALSHQRPPLTATMGTKQRISLLLPPN
jgi:hypothetical protein